MEPYFIVSTSKLRLGFFEFRILRILSLRIENLGPELSGIEDIYFFLFYNYTNGIVAGLLWFFSPEFEALRRLGVGYRVSCRNFFLNLLLILKYFS